VTDRRARAPEPPFPAGSRRPDDAGFSLIELLVNMGLMSVVGAIVTASILQVFRATETMDTQIQAQTQVRIALQRLDTEIRYAYDITEPTTATEATANSGTWYVEFLRVDDATATQTCNQLRLKDGVLVLRQWTPGSSPPAGTALASNIDMDVYSSGSAVAPFELQAAGSTPLGSSPAAVGASFSPDYQRLRLRFVTAVSKRRMSSDVTFTALNTTLATDDTTAGPTADICKTQGR
jgi:type II secretory pathway pseudopilin PulG